MTKKRKGSKILRDSRPLPGGYLTIGFMLFVASLLFWGSGRLDITWAVLGMVLGGVFVLASFKSLKD